MDIAHGHFAILIIFLLIVQPLDLSSIHTGEGIHAGRVVDGHHSQARLLLFQQVNRPPWERTQLLLDLLRLEAMAGRVHAVLPWEHRCHLHWGHRGHVPITFFKA